MQVSFINFVAMKIADFLLKSWTPWRTTCCLCIWWQLWFPQRQRALQAHRAGGDGQQSESRVKTLSFVCWLQQDVQPLQQFSQKDHWQKSSWWTWTFLKLQHRDAPASELCRCKIHKSAFLPSYKPWLPSFLPSFLFLPFWDWPFWGLLSLGLACW